ncbi:hypothetical protein VCRA2116O28_10540 [Vibrio crassostreae]|nr:hypothetical protein VCRA2119O46_10263 [Vibrio crassostreae]CAK1873072.1 hypothetical protein VCRA2116O31_10279 [Vibrio crassostreae]CAK1873269.1 hypothetical protein VCRA2117O37_10280 [Vibrio crassostreae]CAK1889063.1 hypothetical protein VCRA2116O28_10540 [Vibrio crassostreae]CAK1890479.1 hypothetical protein VCRA2116O27_10539 [Vibrio crassostreae]
MNLPPWHFSSKVLLSSAEQSPSNILEQTIIKLIHVYGSYTDIFGRFLTNISFDSHNSVILIEFHNRRQQHNKNADTEELPP